MTAVSGSNSAQNVSRFASSNYTSGEARRIELITAAFVDDGDLGWLQQVLSNASGLVHYTMRPHIFEGV